MFPLDPAHRPGAPSWERRLLEQAWSLQQQGRYREAHTAAMEARDLGRRNGNLNVEIQAIGVLGVCLQLEGDHAGARVHYEQVLTVGRDPERAEAIAQAGVEKVLLTAYLRSVDTALFLPDVAIAPLGDLLDEAEAYVQRLGKPMWRAGILHQRAKWLDALGRLEEALAAAEEGLRLELEDGSAPGTTRAAHHLTLGYLLREAGRYGPAADQYYAVLGMSASPTREENGSLPVHSAIRDTQPTAGRHEQVGARVGLARCLLGKGDLHGARSAAQHALTHAEREGEESQSPALHACTDVFLALGDLALARETSDRAVQIARRTNSPYRLYFALRNAAKVALVEKDASRALALLDEAAPLAATFDRARDRATQSELIVGLHTQAVTLNSGGSSP